MIGKTGGLDCGKKKPNQVAGCQRNYESFLIEKFFLWVFNSLIYQSGIFVLLLWVFRLGLPSPEYR